MTALQRTWGVVAVPLIAIIMSVIVGSIVIVASEWLVSGEVSPGLAVDAFSALVVGAVGNPRVIVNTLVTTVPLLLGGLSVGLAFKGGLFNIGAQGQFLMGALGSVIVGVQLREAPALVAIPAARGARPPGDPCGPPRRHSLRPRLGVHPRVPQGHIRSA